MRRLMLCLVAACAVAAPIASAAPAENSNGVMCVLHAKLAAESETGSTSPSAYYVNYHTTAFPAGAIRGQLQ
jgi:Ni/Co efflux regulator RcnB